MNPNAEIITIGDEILIGQTIDTNSAWIGEHLSLLGIPVIRIVSIPDQPAVIRATIEDAMKQATVILVTGGLGPTNDDRTKHTLCDLFGSRLVPDPEVLKDVEALLTVRHVPMNQINRDQALVPHNCTVIRNSSGTAPGMWFEKDGRIIVSMPGVPYEMISMMESSILPALKECIQVPVILHKNVMTTGIAESALATRISSWENSLPEVFSLAYLPSPGIVKLRITGRGTERVQVQAELEQQVKSLLQIIPQEIYGFDEATLEEVTGQILLDNGLTVATAESCTGGTIASLITSVPGSSSYYRGSIVAYANEIKQHLLGVPDSLLNQFGAVSREVVEQMASAARIGMKADYSLAVSGIAGPDGGSPEKPVGMVWIAVSGVSGTESELYYFGEHRGRNIRRASLAALNLLRKRVLKDTRGHQPNY